MAQKTKSLVIISIAFVSVLAVVMIASYFVWQEMGQIDLGFHGWLAVILGSVGSIGLGAGLMWLSFYSSRQGYDERPADFDKDEE